MPPTEQCLPTAEQQIPFHQNALTNPSILIRRLQRTCSAETERTCVDGGYFIWRTQDLARVEINKTYNLFGLIHWFRELGNQTEQIFTFESSESRHYSFFRRFEAGFLHPTIQVVLSP